MHWFYYYIKKVYTLNDLKGFRELTKNNPDMIFNYNMKSLAPTLLINCLRNDALNLLSKALIDITTLSKDQLDIYNEIASGILQEIFRTYKNQKISNSLNLNLQK